MGDLLDIIDRLDVPSLAAGVIYGFYRVIQALHALELRLISMETKLETHDSHVVKLDKHVRAARGD